MSEHSVNSVGASFFAERLGVTEAATASPALKLEKVQAGAPSPVPAESSDLSSNLPAAQKTAAEMLENPDGTTLDDYYRAMDRESVQSTNVAVTADESDPAPTSAEPAAEVQPATTSPTESIVKPQTENEVALQVIGKTPKDRQRRFAGVLLNKNDTFDGGSELWNALLQAAESSPYMHELQQAFQSEGANEIKAQLDILLTRILINESSSKLGQFAKDMAADDRPKLVAAILYEYFNPEFVVPPKQTFLKRFGVAIKTRVTQPLADFLRRLGGIDLQGLSSQESYPRIADEVTAQQLRKQPVAVQHLSDLDLELNDLQMFLPRPQLF